MVYAAVKDVKKVLKDSLLNYPASIVDEVEFARTYIHGRLAGHYPLPFDATELYASVPVQVKWISAHLTGYKLWDLVVALEGQTSDTAAARWKQLADDWLMRIASLEELLILADGTVIAISNNSLRSYPSGVRTKAKDVDNVPFFTRADAHEW